MTGPDELVGKKHVDATEKRWVKSCETARRDPEPIVAFVAFIGDLLEAWVHGRTELGTIAHAEVVKRCRRLGLNDLDVWNRVKALAQLLPRTIETTPVEPGGNS